MEVRPKLKIQLTIIDKLFEGLGWLTLLVLWFMILWNYSNLPDKIPTHYNARGEVDNFGNKMTIFVLPIIATFLFLSMTIVNKYPHIFNYPKNITSENAAIQYTNATRMMRFSKFIVLFIFSFIVFNTLQVAEGKSDGLGVWFLPIALVLIFIPILFFLIKSLRN